MLLRFFTIAALYFSLLFAPSVSFADVVESDEASAFATFIQDLIRTSHATKDSGVICSMGSDEISRAIASQEKVFFDLTKDPHKVDSCKAIYFAQGRERSVRSEVGKFNAKKIMTIGVFEGFVESGGMIQVQMGRRNFEITLNSKEVKAAGVRLSALVTELVIN